MYACPAKTVKIYGIPLAAWFFSIGLFFTVPAIFMLLTKGQ
jgi:hypothetical protein